MMLAQHGPVVAVVHLSACDRDRFERHLLQLGAEDRRLRFGAAIANPGIAAYVRRIDLVRDGLLGILDSTGEHIIAAAHMARVPDGIELGLSVLPAHRGRGCGTALLQRAALHAQNRHVRRLFVHFLTENTAMVRLARRHDMVVQRSYGEADAWLELPPADQASAVREFRANLAALVSCLTVRPVIPAST
jgi:GNAT superfamily N-acetyltransferase